MPASSSGRKVWVRRAGASATLVSYSEKDVVDEIREKLLRKYGNSLGRVYDAPDITLRLIPRDSRSGDRYLGPDEVMDRLLEKYYPGGQSIDEALIIDVPLRRGTPLSSSPNGGPSYRDTHTVTYEQQQQPPPRTDYFGPTAVATTAVHNQGHSSSSHHAHAHTYQRHAHVHLHQPNLHLPAPSGQAGNGASNSHAAAAASQTVVVPAAASGTSGSPHHHPHSISVLSTGQVPTLPTLPSPGSSWRMIDQTDRPKLSRQRSGSASAGGVKTIHEYSNSLPTLQKTNGADAGSSQRPGTPQISIAAPIPVSASVLLSSQDGGLGEGGNGNGGIGHAHAGDALARGDGGDGSGSVVQAGGQQAVTSPPAHNGAAAGSPRPASPMRSKKPKKLSLQHQMEDDATPSEERIVPLTVPPINVLIVEDNIINLKLLEAFIKRLKVRWQTAMNGRDAVLKWRTGGFHLVLMDIQLPLMSGLEATREIRRLERVNSIGVFASTPSDSIGNGRDPRSDKLENMSLFKSPVIIVALTASSLQSDRNDALAAGCNDFLTKPVNFVWLEKKIMEWGCMQALIDFDGWRKWKELKLPSLTAEASEAMQNEAAKKAKKLLKRPPVQHDLVGGDSSSTIATLSPSLTSTDMAGPLPSPGSVGRSPLSQSVDASGLPEPDKTTHAAGDAATRRGSLAGDATDGSSTVVTVVGSDTTGTSTTATASS